MPLLRPHTRPTARHDRERLLSFLGFSGRLSFATYPATYTTPTFEAEVISRAGLPPLPNWRQADVLIVEMSKARRRSQKTRPRLRKERAVAGSSWHRFLFGDQVIGLRVDPSDRRKAGHLPLMSSQGYFLSSVSARDPDRVGISIWTSRNFAARATGTPEIARLLEGIGTNDALPASLVEIAQDLRLSL